MNTFDPRIKSSLLIIISLLLLQNHIRGKCSKGTLKCLSPETSNSASLICDPSKNYVLSETRCIYQDIPNCIITLNENECKVCQFGKNLI